MKRLTIVLMFAVIAAIAAIAGGGYRYWTQQARGTGVEAQPKGTGEREPITVRAVHAVAKPMPVLIEAVGTVDPEHSVQVRAQVSGVIQSVQFKEGDRVKAGQLLFQIDPRTFQAQKNQALATPAHDKAQFEHARAEQQRLESLLKREFITRQEYDVAITSLKLPEANVHAGAEQTRAQFKVADIRAPIAGRTGKLAIKPGDLVVAAGTGTPLVTINTIDSILVSFSIPERQLEDINRFQGDSSMRIEILLERNAPPVAEGKLMSIDNTATAQTGAVLLKTQIPNKSEAIRPGQSVNVRIILTIEPDAIVVPEAAVQPGQDGSFVYLIDEHSKVKVQPVKVSRQLGGDVVIASGLKAGDRVITEIPKTLTPGASVQLAGTEIKGGKGEKGKKGMPEAK